MSKIQLTVILIISLIGLISSNPMNKNDMFGCGPGRINIDRLLTIVQREQIIPCCVQHDICYRTCNKTRAECDCALYSCITQKCITRAPKSIDCFIYAYKFYKLVRVGGLSSYISDQKEGKCSSTDFKNELRQSFPQNDDSTESKLCGQYT